MDSKLRRIAILSSMAVILLVSLLVLNMNPKNAGGSNPPGGQQQADEPPSAGSGAAGGQIGNDLSAFLRDDTFFDPEPDPVLEAIKEKRSRLSLAVTSVERDLRIQIVDVEGTPVAGKSFLVELGDAGQYEDLDQDGIIYIEGLEAGEYSVRLHPIEGYRVPEDELKVTVKGEADPPAIEDMPVLAELDPVIVTEAEVDAETEDIVVRGLLTDRNYTEIQELQKLPGAKTGIDVSKWNGEIDWKQVSEAGVEFAIIRAGYRGAVSGSLVKDPFFEDNMKGAAANGIPVGVYFSTQAVNEAEAVEEAFAALKLVGEYQLAYPVFVDTEGVSVDGRTDALDAETRALLCEAFCRTVESEGYDAGIYGSRYWYGSRLKMDGLQDYYIWLADYQSVPQYEGKYHIWQYTASGTVDGISGSVGLNVSYIE